MSTNEETERLLQEAHAARSRRDLDGSANALHKALHLARQENAPAIEYRVWMDLGTTRRARCDYEGALNCFQMAESAALRAGDTIARVRATLRRVSCLMRLARCAEAIKLQTDTMSAHGVTVMSEAMLGTEIEVGLILTTLVMQVASTPKETQAAFERILELKDICDVNILLRAYVGRANALEQQHRLHDAAHVYNELADFAARAELADFAAEGLAHARRCTDAAKRTVH